MNSYDAKAHTPLLGVSEKGSSDSEQAVNKYSGTLVSDYVC